LRFKLACQRFGLAFVFGLFLLLREPVLFGFFAFSFLALCFGALCFGARGLFLRGFFLGSFGFFSLFAFPLFLRTLFLAGPLQRLLAGLFLAFFLPLQGNVGVACVGRGRMYGWLRRGYAWCRLWRRRWRCGRRWRHARRCLLR